MQRAVADDEVHEAGEFIEGAFFFFEVDAAYSIDDQLQLFGRGLLDSLI
jgi:hypothetical protein